MRYALIVVVLAVAIGLRIRVFRRRRQRAAGDGAPLRTTEGGATAPRTSIPAAVRRRPAILQVGQDVLGDAGLVAGREIKERVRGRIFRIGTLLILVVVALAIIIPAAHKGGSGPTVQTVGVVGELSPEAEQLVHLAARQNDDSARLVPQPSLAAAKAGLRSGKLDLVIVEGSQVLLNESATASSSPADPGLVQTVAAYLGVLEAYRTAGLTPAQAAQVTNSKPVPVHTLQPGSKSTLKATSVIGLVLLFFMLTQYCTWILIGVMQEKASRVVEVLLATLRPIQLLGGKVLGIGLVALGQAALIVGFALIVARAVGSDLLKGTAPLVLLSELLWLVLGYAFYCWVYAAAGSTAERQDQVQTLALPLSIPILLGYIFAITVASSGHSNIFFDVLAYVPPTAPFCMPVLVALGEVQWWQFVLSVLITIAGTVAMASFAARIYRRAVLQTGGRVRIRELFARPAH
jgi:ABC-2 type transport system permease protein